MQKFRAKSQKLSKILIFVKIGSVTAEILVTLSLFDGWVDKLESLSVVLLIQHKKS